MRQPGTISPWFSMLIPFCLGAALFGITEGRQETIRPASIQPIDLARYELRRIYEIRFGRPEKISREEDFIERLTDGSWRRIGKPAADAEWIAEGWGGCVIRDGMLRVAPAGFDENGRPRKVESGRRSHMVVWNRRIFPADFLMELEMNPRGSTNGLTIVLFCAAGKDGADIFDLSLPPRRADYVAYHSGAIANYFVLL